MRMAQQICGDLTDGGVLKMKLGWKPETWPPFSGLERRGIKRKI
jgi:hypothetical protein